MGYALRAGITGSLLLACSGSVSCSSPGPATAPATTPQLWYAGTAVCALSHEQLQGSDAAAIQPSVVVTTSSLTMISDFALDSDGNAWVVGSGSNHVLRFSKASLGKTGSVEPDLVIKSTVLQDPGNLVFDSEGSLWVANRPAAEASTTDGTIVRFDIPSGATGTQNLTPKMRITAAMPGDLVQIGSIGFDAEENLWVTSFAGVSRFDHPRSQTGLVAMAPSAVIDKAGYANDIYFYGAAFDASGALWTTSGDGFHYLTSLTRFDHPSSLTGRSSPAPSAKITGGKDLLPGGGIAFDVSGNLWTATGESILEYANPSKLHGTVNPSPTVTIPLQGEAAPVLNTHLAFFPPPAGPDAGRQSDAGHESDASRVSDAGADAESGTEVGRN